MGHASNELERKCTEVLTSVTAEQLACLCVAENNVVTSMVMVPQCKIKLKFISTVKKHVANEGLFLHNLTAHISPVLLVFYIIKSKEFPQIT